MKKTVRKPKVLKAGRIFPRVEAEEGRIWMQNCKGGKWIKVPVKRAEYIIERMQRAVDYVNL